MYGPGKHALDQTVCRSSENEKSDGEGESLLLFPDSPSSAVRELPSKLKVDKGHLSPLNRTFCSTTTTTLTRLGGARNIYRVAPTPDVASSYVCP